jgi:hypothetical protein
MLRVFFSTFREYSSKSPENRTSRLEGVALQMDLYLLALCRHFTCLPPNTPASRDWIPLLWFHQIARHTPSLGGLLAGWPTAARTVGGF